MKKEKNRTEQLNLMIRIGVCLRPFSTKSVTKSCLFAGRLVSFLVFNSILNWQKLLGYSFNIRVLISAKYKDHKGKG